MYASSHKHNSDDSHASCYQHPGWTYSTIHTSATVVVHSLPPPVNITTCSTVPLTEGPPAFSPHSRRGLSADSESNRPGANNPIGPSSKPTGTNALAGLTAASTLAGGGGSGSGILGGPSGSGRGRRTRLKTAASLDSAGKPRSYSSSGGGLNWRGGSAGSSRGESSGGSSGSSSDGSTDSEEGYDGGRGQGCGGSGWNPGGRGKEVMTREI